MNFFPLHNVVGVIICMLICALFNSFLDVTENGARENKRI